MCFVYIRKRAPSPLLRCVQKSPIRCVGPQRPITMQHEIWRATLSFSSSAGARARPEPRKSYHRYDLCTRVSFAPNIFRRTKVAISDLRATHTHTHTHTHKRTGETGHRRHTDTQAQAETERYRHTGRHTHTHTHTHGRR